jgi:hypothetical protein
MSTAVSALEAAIGDAAILGKRPTELVEHLSTLGQLFRDELLTQREFTQAKATLLGAQGGAVESPPVSPVSAHTLSFAVSPVRLLEHHPQAQEELSAASHAAKPIRAAKNSAEHIRNSGAEDLDDSDDANDDCARTWRVVSDWD